MMSYHSHHASSMAAPGGRVPASSILFPADNDRHRLMGLAEQHNFSPLAEFSAQAILENEEAAKRISEQIAGIVKSSAELAAQEAEEHRQHEHKMSMLDKEEAELRDRIVQNRNTVSDLEHRSAVESTARQEDIQVETEARTELEEELRSLSGVESELVAMRDAIAQKLRQTSDQTRLFAREFQEGMSVLEQDRSQTRNVAETAAMLSPAKVVQGGVFLNEDRDALPHQLLSRTATTADRNKTLSPSRQHRTTAAAVPRTPTPPPRAAPYHQHQSQSRRLTPAPSPTRTHFGIGGGGGAVLEESKRVSPMRGPMDAAAAFVHGEVDHRQQQREYHAAMSMSAPPLGGGVQRTRGSPVPPLHDPVPRYSAAAVRGSPQRTLPLPGGNVSATNVAGSHHPPSETVIMSSALRHRGGDIVHQQTSSTATAVGEEGRGGGYNRRTTPPPAMPAADNDQQFDEQRNVPRLHALCARSPPVPQDVTREIQQTPGCINEQDNNGNTALHAACRSGAASLEVVHALLLAGISTTARNEQGHTAFHVACLNMADSNDHKLKKFLIFKGAQNPNQRTSRGETAAHLCATNDKYLSILRFLVSVGVDVDAVALLTDRRAGGGQQRRMTPLDVAKSSGGVALECRAFLESMLARSP